MISEVMSFVCSDSYENGVTKENVHTKGSGIFFSEYDSVCRVLKQWTGILKMSNTWTYVGTKSGGREAEFQEKIGR